MKLKKLPGRPRVHASSPSRDRKRSRDLQRYYTNDELLTWARYAVQNAKRRARKRGLAFALSIEDVLALAKKTQVCPILRVPLVYSRGKGNQQYAASIDRVDNSRGYFPDSIAICSVRANTLKSNCSLRDMIALGHYAAAQLIAGNDVVQGLISI